MNWFRATKGAAVLVTLAGAGCTAVLDHSPNQCQTSADCVGFHYHPRCEQGVCVPSKLQPDNCFLATSSHPPTTPEDFLNQCSTGALLSGPENAAGACLSFDRAADEGATIKPPPPPTPAIAKPVKVPTVSCNDLLPPGKSILYMTGSSNFPPLLEELAPAIMKRTAIAPVFRITTSCTGVRAMNPRSETYSVDHYIKDPVAVGDPYAQIFLGDGNAPVSCLLGSAGIPVEVGESEIAQDTCGTIPTSPDVGEGLGPILPMVLVVPRGSSERAISFQAAGLVFGGGGGVMPWEDYKFIYIRGQGTATLRLVAKQLELLPTQFWGIDQGTAQAMATNLGLLTAPEDAKKAIGILGSDYYDQDQSRGDLKALGFQGKNQLCAYLPDSTLASKDKMNVRDGHYTLWGRIHFFSGRTNNNMPASDTAAAFVSLLTTPSLAPEVLTALAKAGFVPDCAMKVKRDKELGDLSVDDPPSLSCGCAFDAVVGASPRPECQACDGNSDCREDRPSCNYKFCEQE